MSIGRTWIEPAVQIDSDLRLSEIDEANVRKMLTGFETLYIYGVF